MWGSTACRQRPAAAALLALVACATLATLVAAAIPSNVVDRRALLVEEGEEGEPVQAVEPQAAGSAPEPWGNVNVLNGCPYPVRIKAAYQWMAGVDDGQACANPQPTSEPDLTACSTAWQAVRPGRNVTLQGLPEFLWSFAAQVEGSSPAYYLSRQQPDAVLATAGNYAQECGEEAADACIWWGVPDLDDDNAQQLTLRCPGYQPGPLPPPDLAPVEVENQCSQPVKFKISYQLPEGDEGEGCAMKKYFGEWNHRCITEWQTLEPGESRFIAETTDPYWEFGAVVADPASGVLLYDVARQSQGFFQAGNDTLGCPEEDVYGRRYTCEWWAPNCFMCETYNTTAPLTFTCDDFSVPLPSSV